MNNNELSFDWVFVAKGIGIILVVIGHYFPYDSPEYWVGMKSIIYSFHMPLFFVLSGFLYSYEKYSYSALIQNKVKRLLYPFISVAIIFFVIRYFSSLFFIQQNPVKIENVYALLIDPVNSYVPLLWFIYSLFLIFLVYPLLRNIINNNVAILAIFVLVNLLFGSDYLVIGKALANIPFFIIGITLRENKILRDKVMSGEWFHLGVSLIIFFLIYLFMLEMKNESQLAFILKLLSGISGTVCVINISLLLNGKRRTGAGRAMLTAIGSYSMAIYFFHTIFESGVRIVFYQVLGDFNVGFELVALMAIVAGVAFPLFIEQIFLRKYSFTRKYILGVK